MFKKRGFEFDNITLSASHRSRLTCTTYLSQLLQVNLERRKTAQELKCDIVKLSIIQELVTFHILP
ncbi:MAG: hypothetical protein VSS75_022805 [Candidatus Parabeggiatoa sp.]|nr:hypothetical protein [Candidatus Parabeggiatoa sp.]